MNCNLLGLITVTFLSTAPPARAAVAGPPDCIPITSAASIVHLGSLDSFDITEGGKKAARALLTCLETGDTNAAATALDVYRRIIPNENFGGEYTALQWFCEYLLASPVQQQAMRGDPLVDSFYHFFANDHYYSLRRYLNRKYYLVQKEEKGADQMEERFLEDFILFNNPRRETWEKTSKIVEALRLQPGQVIADVGSGPGYYTFKFAKLVGPTGRVYAIDTNPKHCDYLSQVIGNLGVKNVEVIRSTEEDISLFKQVDVVFMCSLYHILYGSATSRERDHMIESIRKVLKKTGRLVIVDNALVRQSELPYHGPFIAKELIIAQLKYYGFLHVATHQFTPQRYVLEFQLAEGGPPPEQHWGAERGATNLDCITAGKKSLLCLQFTRCTEGAKAGSRLLLNGLENNDADAIKAAHERFTQLIPKENFGSEYTALQWFCEYWLAPAAERAKLVTNAVVRDYCRFFAEEDWAVLKEYLKRQYELAETADKQTKAGMERLTFLRDFILFNNPRREQWEQTSKIIGALGLKPGDTVADVGCGPGYYSFQFANLVGATGRVHAIDINENHTDYLTNFVRKHDVKNVQVIRSRMNDICLADPVDMVFLCSLYPMVYLTSLEPVKDEFIGSIHKALKDGGRLVIVDNDIVEEPTLPYHGPFIDRRLIITQLKHYGFRLVETHQFIPQRYVLVFKTD